MPSFKIKIDDKPTVLAAMRQNLPDEPSWSTVRKLMRGRFVAVGGVLCLDESRRLSSGEEVTINEHPMAAPPRDEDVKMRFVDKQIIVVEKPAGMITLRRKSEYAWPWSKRNQQPTLDECIPRIIGEYAAQKANKQRIHNKQPRILSVHRIDRDSSGLLVFARDEDSQTKIIHQFAQHAAVRKYLAIIPGSIDDQTIRSQFIRDRGDGQRGSTDDTSVGEHAVTHFKTIRKIGQFSELECRLETGRTNQIRIHLAEAGHPICGDIKYRGPFGQSPIEDKSKIHRMALHAAELKFKHPKTGELLEYETPWSTDMLRFIDRLK